MIMAVRDGDHDDEDDDGSTTLSLRRCMSVISLISLIWGRIRFGRSPDLADSQT